LLTQTEMADVARRVCMAQPGLDVVVDADTGYGNAINVLRTVDLWRQAGAAGVFIEDQVWPKRCGHMAGKQVVDRDDWLAKLRAAVAHADGMFVTARTDARAVVSLHEAIERGRMARDLGVDAVFVEAPESVVELEQIAAALPDVTLVANMVEAGRTPLLTLDELRALGFGLVLSPVSVLFAATQAMRDTLVALRADGTLRDRLSTLVGFAEFGEIVGLGQRTLDATRFGVANVSAHTHHE
jgi:methylisocitrate lyase